MKSEMKHIGTICVDAGLCFMGDPCYTIGKNLGKQTWEEFLKYIGGVDNDFISKELSEGIVVSTGYGDGVYPVFAEIEDGRIVSVTIDFSLG